MITLRDSVPLSGELPFISQSQPSEGRKPGLVIECPLCEGLEATFVHAVDTKISTRPSAFGSDTRPTIDVLAGCEKGGHIFVIEIANRKGEINIGTRAPYSGEVISAWHKGSFDNWVLDGTVFFNLDFSFEAAK